MKLKIEFLLLTSLLLYSLFLIPTGLLLHFIPWHDDLLSRSIGEAWQAGFWQFPGCSEKVSRIVLDILRACDIGLLGWLFYLGYKVLEINHEVPNEKKHEKSLRIRWVLLWPLLCGLLLLAVIPFHSSDLYGYLNRGFQQSVFHTNPYLTPIGDIPGWQNSALLHPHWIDNPCPYGVFFAQFMLWLVRLTGPIFWKAFLLFKALNVLLVLGSTALIIQIAQKLGLKRPWQIGYCFGANPLVLLHAIGNGHNDILLIFLLLAAFSALFSNCWGWLCLPLLTLSILTKYASLLALPFILIAIWKKRNYKALIVGLFLSIAVGLGFAQPYNDPHHPWPINAMLDNAEKPQHSPIAMVYELVAYPTQWFTHEASHSHFVYNAPPSSFAEDGEQPHSMQANIPWFKVLLLWLKRLFDVGFLLFYASILWLCWGIFRGDGQSTSVEETNRKLIRACGLTMAVFIAGISAKFHPWYPVMFLPLALLQVESSPLRRFALLFSLFQLAGFTVFQNLPVLSELTLTIIPFWMAFCRLPLNTGE